MREHTSSADWLRNGVATWSGSVFLYDSRRPRPVPSRAEADPVSEDPDPIPAPKRMSQAEAPSDRLVVYAKPNEYSDWSQGEWLISGQQNGPRKVSGLDGGGNGWGIEFGTGRRVRMRHWRFVDE